MKPFRVCGKPLAANIPLNGSQMIVTNNLNEIKDILTGTCLTIGNFDGVHLGHR